jgi:hypothetical protein
VKRIRVVLAAVAVSSTALVLAGAAGADDVAVNPPSVTIEAGGAAATVSFTITVLPPQDPDPGCNADATTPAVVTVSAPPPVVASPTQLTFTSCDAGQSVAFSAPAGATPGDYTVGVSVADAGGGEYNLSSSSITVTVTAPPPPPPPADTTAPVLTLPSPITTEATSAGGAAVTFTASATDETDGAVPVSCTPPSGSTFPVGTTTVNCSAQDAAGNVGSGAFTVTVTDSQPPVLTLPGPITVDATSAAGAVVTFDTSATDAVSGARAVSCSPPSGAAFPVGATTVNCSAQDAAGNVASGSFVVTVRDAQPPALSLPAPISTVATSAAGAVVTFNASATDAVDGARPVSCSPASGTTFPVGSTTVTCTAADASGNNAQGSFSVTVTDAAPAIAVPPAQRVEATGPAGANVAYQPAPSASDTVDGPLPVSCSPPSGARFPLGTTTVTCTAVDSAGSAVTGSFEVAVVDTTPPVVTVPPSATFVSSGGPLPRSSVEVGVYLTRARALDLVDPAPMLFVEAPDSFPYGDTVVRFVAVDSSGNRASDSTTIKVIPPPPPGQPRPVPPADDPPPGNVVGLRAIPANRAVRLSWTAPRDADLARYAVFRSERTGPQVQVYSGAATSFVDRGLVNGTEYRYVVVAYDRAGHRSVGVAALATPYLPMLVAPRDGARLARGTMFSWRRIPNARYYNLQVFRAAGIVGETQRFQKVLSVWPVTNRFRLGSTWRFEGRRHRLTAGTYRWYVWPGYGARRDARYGTLLGERTFVVVPRRR